MSTIICIIIWCAAGLFFWFIYKQKNSADDLAKETTSLSSQKEEIKAMARDIEQVKPVASDLDVFVVSGTQEGIVSFIEIVESLGASSNVVLKVSSVDVFELEDRNLAEDYETLSLGLEATGGWQNIFHFLNLLETLPYKLTIKQANLSTVGILEDIQQWRGNFILNVIKFR